MVNIRSTRGSYEDSNAVIIPGHHDLNANTNLVSKTLIERQTSVLVYERERCLNAKEIELSWQLFPITVRILPYAGLRPPAFPALCASFGRTLVPVADVLVFYFAVLCEQSRPGPHQ